METISLQCLLLNRRRPMVDIFLCDDKQVLLDSYEEIITAYIQQNILDAQVRLKTKNGYDLLIFLQESQTQGGVYFLDIDLENDVLDGMELALKIRELDPYAQIAFVSTHDELLMETIQRRINVLNFILKDRGLAQVRADIQATINDAIKLRQQQVPLAEEPAYFEYDDGLSFEKVAIQEINYFETAHKARHVFLHSDHRLSEFVGKIVTIQAQLPQFFRAHKSILVNPDKVVRIDKETHQVIFANGDTCDVSYRRIEALLKLIQADKY